MKPPQIVVFDLGKVLLDFDYGIVAPRIAAQGKVSAPDAKRLLNQSPLLYRFETGLMTNQEFYDEVRSATGFQGGIEAFGEIFGDIFAPIAPMIELHAAVRKQGVPVYIFSNTNELAIRHIRRHHPFFADFDDYIFSYEHGAMKPDVKLYEVLERVTKRRGAEILYLDDRAENVEAGAARGWRVVLHETPEKSRAALAAAGLLGQALAPGSAP
jgi:HAD superfamily hydrolase (TIGR01509 family)